MICYLFSYFFHSKLLLPCSFSLVSHLLISTISLCASVIVYACFFSTCILKSYLLTFSFLFAHLSLHPFMQLLVLLLFDSSTFLAYTSLFRSSWLALANIFFMNVLHPLVSAASCGMPVPSSSFASSSFDLHLHSTFTSSRLVLVRSPDLAPISTPFPAGHSPVGLATHHMTAFRPEGLRVGLYGRRPL